VIGVIRVVAAGIVAMVGLPFVAHPYPTTMGGWLGWIAVAIVAGSLAGKPRRVWVLLIALITLALVANQLGWTGDLRRYWWLSSIVAALAAILGFLGGAILVGPSGPAQELRGRWTGLGKAGRRLVIGSAVLLVLAFVGYGGYAFVVGGGQYAAQAPNPGPCDNPGQRYGWAFEPINYDGANQPTALDPAAAKVICANPGPPAGSEVVSSDGIPIAGWYVPAASGPGPTGPTVVIVHGGQSNKTDGLRYAPPFHADYNIVLIDLRNAGQSGGHLSSGGLFEQRDLRAMIDWLERTKHPSWLAVMGNSNGAATALAEARGDDRVRALILDSMHAGIELQMGNVIETEHNLPAWPTGIALVAGASYAVGGDLTSVDPIQLITQVGSRPILLTHGSADDVDRPTESLDRNVAAAVGAGIDLEVHVCVGAGHGQVVTVCKDQWASWVTTFLAASIGR
jgi:pimeloyl-ACP methyl ester carboxylesterase